LIAGTRLRPEAPLPSIAGVTCESPPPVHCPNVNCPRELIAHDGNTLLPKSNRAFFLDYPCDLKPGEPVTFVLNLHGGGAIGNRQRHYFPIMDLKGKYRLIVATPECRDGRVVADVIRLGKGHTEGFEPRVTEEIVKMMLSAS
jgi:poly(3-hydroxybutyrate) depolymerase